MDKFSEERIRTLIQKYLTDNLTTTEQQELGKLAINYPGVTEILDQMKSEGIASPGFQQRQQEELERGLGKAHAIIYPNKEVGTWNEENRFPEERVNVLLKGYFDDALTEEERIEFGTLLLIYPQIQEIAMKIINAGQMSEKFKRQREGEMKRGKKLMKEYALGTAHNKQPWWIRLFFGSKW